MKVRRKRGNERLGITCKGKWKRGEAGQEKPSNISSVKDFVKGKRRGENIMGGKVSLGHLKR